MTHKIVAMLSSWETCEVKVFGENFQIPPVRTRQAVKPASVNLMAGMDSRSP
jgi:hypothetical protein